MTVRMMDPFCEIHGTWHAEGACATIDALRASLAPRMVDQLDLFDPPPTVLCVACGATVDGDEMFCDRCEATIRVAEHVGRTNGLMAQQRDVLGFSSEES